MVNNLSIVFMVISLLIAVLMPIILAIYFYKREKINIRVLFIGVIVFIVSQMLTRIPLLSYINTQEWYKAMSSNIVVIAVFLGLTAGLFEEVGRFLAMKYFMKNNLRWKDGLAFGIGHGGIESIVLVGMTLLNYIVISFMINAGLFESMIGAKLPPETAGQIKSMLVNTPVMNSLAGGYERIMAMIIQIAFSIIVLCSVRFKKPLYLVYAILLHGIVDTPLVILASMNLNVWVMELYVTACAAAGLIFIIKSRKLLASTEKQMEQHVVL